MVERIEFCLPDLRDRTAAIVRGCVGEVRRYFEVVGCIHGIFEVPGDTVVAAKCFTIAATSGRADIARVKILLKRRAHCMVTAA